ncbi:site-specific DNA-methyltransferase, partial [bacterium]|nr:site-specific DNA-methyltransferase [bacterium]
MEKLDPKTDGCSKDMVCENVEKLKHIFPEIFAEDKIDFQKLKETLGDYTDAQEERYDFTWYGKSSARRIAQTPSTGTLRPCKAESKHWDTTGNLFIEGDNLEVLKLLQKSYHKRIKMIYIDPPYNTGKEFIYPDNYKDNLDTYLRYTGQIDDEGYKFSSNTEQSGRYHTNWLNMMYPRLKLARNLLRDDGVIFISIDDNEQSNLKKICDEIFGEDNCLSQLSWKTVYGGGAKAKHVVQQHETIIIYAREKMAIDKIELPPDPEARKRYTAKDDKFELRGPYYTQPLATNSMDNRPNLRFPIFWKGKEIWPEKQWQWSKERVEEALENDDLVLKQNEDGRWSVRYKQYLRDNEGKERGAKLFSILNGPWSQEGTSEIRKLFGNGKVFPFPKPSNLIKHLLSTFWEDKEAIILDFFAGSCSTTQAMFSLSREHSGNRKFIMVQLPEPCDEKTEAFKAGYKTIADIGKERIRRAGEKIIEENLEKEGIENLDIGFKVFKLDSSNIKPWDADFDKLEDALWDLIENIKKDRTQDDVLYELLLKFGLDLTMPIEERKISGKTVYITGLGALVICLDSNVSIDVV